MKKALVIGVNSYSHVSSLAGCVNDAKGVARVLGRNGDGSKNFQNRIMLAEGNELISRSELRQAVQELFSGEGEVALLYFAGHGFVDAAGGYICSSDVTSGDDGLSLYEVVTFANQSKFRDRLIILDSCHSGIAGSRATQPAYAELSEGLTILTASTATQSAMESGGSGVFTSLFIDALEGAAANLVGDITPGSVYAHIDQSLGAWQQRPMFRTNVQNFVSLRKTQPPLSLEDLQKISALFPRPGFEFKLDPSYEPESEEAVMDRVVEFQLLQAYNRVNLVVPVGEKHMYYAAMNSKSCKLTLLGEHYRRLVEQGLI